jgi:hypothetical protein
MGFKSNILFILFALFSNHFFGQIEVFATNNPQTIAEQLVGEAIEISNVKITGSNIQIGTFNDDLAIVGIQKGIVMASGNINNALGPNASGKAGDETTGATNDPYLIELGDKNGVTFKDAIIVEFDFIPKGTVISFKYVFASEEYPEYDQEFPDLFGFWISGEGIAQPTNLAKVPNTDIEINTKTISSADNSQYYNSNGDGNTPIFNQFLGYDGYTDVLVAEYEVVPCKKYHLKFAIADANDQILDSGVFIETKSFNSFQNPIISLDYESSRDKIFEECAPATLNIETKNNTSSPLKFLIEYTGTATDSDFNPASLPSEVVFAPNDSKKSFSLNAIQDLLQEGEEQLIISLKPECDLGFTTDSIIVLVEDGIQKEVQDFVWCNEDTFKLATFDKRTDLLIFEPTTNLSCLNCAEPMVYLTGKDTIYYTFIDKATDCTTKDTFEIQQFIPEMVFSIDTSAYYTVLDIVGEIDSTNLTSFYWDINHRNYQGKSVLHQSSIYGEDKVCLDIYLTGVHDSLKCMLKQDTALCLDKKIFIPNVITPNGDDKNDSFVPIGISSGFWDLTVYNRDGKKVAFLPNYHFDFEGENLSDGVYFYNLENKFKDRQYKGWLQILH